MMVLMEILCEGTFNSFGTLIEKLLDFERIKKCWIFGKKFSAGNSKLHFMGLEDCPSEMCFFQKSKFFRSLCNLFSLYHSKTSLVLSNLLFTAFQRKVLMEKVYFKQIFELLFSVDFKPNITTPSEKKLGRIVKYAYFG